MTGFGSARGVLAGQEVAVEVRTLNHRFLLLKPRLPPLVAALEGELEAVVREFIQRGTVHLGVSLRARAGGRPPAFSHAAAAGYVAQLRRLARELKLPFEVDLRLLTMLPGVVQEAADAGRDADGLGEELFPLVRTALAMAVRAREREGEALRRDLLRRTKTVAELVRAVERRAPAVVADYRARLHRRLDEVLAGKGVTLLATDLAREVALFADRADITEELTRLGLHLVELRRLLQGAEGLGRRLDFLLQEIHREINTIGSKAADAAIAHEVITLKSELEKLREQVQNLE
jgi:uncharacterized protein (TIGR00255 family)